MLTLRILGQHFARKHSSKTFAKANTETRMQKVHLGVPLHSYDTCCPMQGRFDGHLDGCKCLPPISDTFMLASPVAFISLSLSPSLSLSIFLWLRRTKLGNIRSRIKHGREEGRGGKLRVVRAHSFN